MNKYYKFAFNSLAKMGLLILSIFIYYILMTVTVIKFPTLFMIIFTLSIFSFIGILLYLTGFILWVVEGNKK